MRGTPKHSGRMGFEALLSAAADPLGGPSLGGKTSNAQEASFSPHLILQASRSSENSISARSARALLHCILAQLSLLQQAHVLLPRGHRVN